LARPKAIALYLQIVYFNIPGIVAEYTIKHLEQFSGIKAHTIRIWEQRYQLFSPSRQGNNVRVYNNEDLQKILNIGILYKAGLKISKIAKLTVSELQEKVKELTLQQKDGLVFGIIEQLAISMTNLDETGMEKLLNNQIIRIGFERTIAEIVFPFLEKIGIMWQIGMILPSQEHFASNIIRQKLIVAIDSLPVNEASKNKAILFLPEKELHEFSLLFYTYIARARGFQAFYLGQTVPFDDLGQIAQIIKPKLIVTVITQPMEISVDEFLKKLSEQFPELKILASGYQSIHQNISPRKNLSIFNNHEDFKECISQFTKL
jgi:MerR family transcriptional regulator, light-induced transcriptional regulator